MSLDPGKRQKASRGDSDWSEGSEEFASERDGVEGCAESGRHAECQFDGEFEGFWIFWDSEALRDPESLIQGS